MSWKETIFKLFIQLQRGYDLPRSQMKDGPYPVVGSNCIIGYHNEFKLEPPGVITGRSGTLGKVQFITTNYWPHNTALWVRDFKNNDPKFAYYKLQTLNLEKYNAGGAVPTLNRNNLDNIPVRIPLLPIQRKIASILSAYDDLIENNLRQIALLEESVRLLYKEWFVRLRFPGHEHTRIINGVPEGWEKCTIKDLGEVVTGKTPITKDSDNYDGDIPFIKTPDMHGQIFVVSTETCLSEKGANTQKGKYVPENTILVSCIGTIGVVAITSKISQFNQQINAVKPFEGNTIYYCYFAFKDLKEKMEAIGGGATMGNVNKRKFENLEVLRPSYALLRDFHQFCAPSFVQIKTLSLQNQRLKQARDLLLPKLMSGEIQV